jgi:hypothetical protein
LVAKQDCESGGAVVQLGEPPERGLQVGHGVPVIVCGVLGLADLLAQVGAVLPVPGAGASQFAAQRFQVPGSRPQRGLGGGEGRGGQVGVALVVGGRCHRLVPGAEERAAVGVAASWLVVTALRWLAVALAGVRGHHPLIT